MDHLNDHLNAPALTTGNATRSVPKRHYLRGWANQASAVSARRQFIAEAPAGEHTREPFDSLRVIQKLPAGQAVKLRARKLSVLRIAHGRVWVTVTEVGPYSRVIAGDHFLSRGDSLTLLAGQELVMEPFGRGEMTSAQFSWGPPGAAAVVTHVAVAPNWRGGVMQPLIDLRHAAGLAARAMGRLVLGVGHAFVAEVERVGNYVAMIFVADGARKSRAGSTFNAVTRDSGAPCKSC
jgi:Protein of unknown function (DUF2917)